MTVERVPSRPAALALGLLAGLAALAIWVSAARGADRVYWANFSTDKISSANLDGAGGIANLNPGSATVDEPIGVAIDPVAGRVYWANHTGGKISYANLDGSGGGDLETGAATLSGPEGVAVDVAGRRIYWANSGANKISWANLDGSGGGDLETGAAMIEKPGGIAFYPAAGRVYWTNLGVVYGWISYANVDGSGGATLPISPSTPMEFPFGLAIDAAAGKIWWVNDVGNRISYANLDGSANADLDLRGLHVKGPYGVALDPADGKVYFATTQGNAIGFARMDGSGGAYLPFKPPEGSGVNFPALLETPRSTAVPQVTSNPLIAKPKSNRKGGAKTSRQVGVVLRCARGAWASDLVEAFLYRGARSTSIQWTRDGNDVPGADSEVLSTQAVGDYRCRETAVNHAGTATHSSQVAAFFRVGKAKPNAKKGTARLEVETPPGKLVLGGKGVAPRTLERSDIQTLRAVNQTVMIRPTGSKRKALESRGRVKVKAKLTFFPQDGPAVSQTARIQLLKQLPR